MFADTLRALVAPRRAVPLALVGASLLSAEWFASRSPRALLLVVVIFVGFTASAPALWRAIFARPLRTPAQHGLAWALYTAASALLVGSLTVLLPVLFAVERTYVAEPNSRGVLGVLFMVGGWGLGRDIELEADVLHARARAERLAVEAEHAQILALRAQLDPHFLFNTLNAIAEWCREDPVVAERAMLDLAALLRAVFDALQTPEWRLEREIALLRQLAALYTTRDGGRYQFDFVVDLPATAQHVPSLLLLPLFENAIKHGPSAGKPGTIKLVVRAVESDVEVTIENPGAFGGPREGGAGIASVERRLRLTYGERVRPIFTSTDDSTSVRLVLPAKERAS